MSFLTFWVALDYYVFLMHTTDFRQQQNVLHWDAAVFWLLLLFHFGFSDAGIKALIAIPILFFSSTVAAHALIRGTYHFGVKLSDKSVKDDYKNAVK